LAGKAIAVGDVRVVGSLPVPPQLGHWQEVVKTLAVMALEAVGLAPLNETKVSSFGRGCKAPFPLSLLIRPAPGYERG
jgi:hypothetical protein